MDKIGHLRAEFKLWRRVSKQIVELLGLDQNLVGADLRTAVMNNIRTLHRERDKLPAPLMEVISDRYDVQHGDPVLYVKNLLLDYARRSIATRTLDTLVEPVRSEIDKMTADQAASATLKDCVQYLVDNRLTPENRALVAHFQAQKDSLIQIYKDGDSYCAVPPGFVNLAESPSGWGDNPQEALASLLAEPAPASIQELAPATNDQRTANNATGVTIVPSVTPPVAIKLPESEVVTQDKRNPFIKTDGVHEFRKNNPAVPWIALNNFDAPVPILKSFITMCGNQDLHYGAVSNSLSLLPDAGLEFSRCFGHLIGKLRDGETVSVDAYLADKLAKSPKVWPDTQSKADN